MPGGEERGSVVVFPVLANASFCVATRPEGFEVQCGGLNK